MFNKFIWPLRILFFIFFFTSAFSKIYPNPDVAIHLFEKEQIMSLGIPISIATWLSRALIALEFTLAFGFIIPVYFKRVTLPFSFLLLTFFSLFLTYEVFVLGKWTGNCGCFGQLIPMTPPVSLIKNIIALLLLVLIYRNKTLFNERKQPSMIYLIIGYFVVFSLIYFISPIDHIGKQPILNNKTMGKLSPEVELLQNKFPGLKKGGAVLCFYSPTCHHCMNTAKSLHAMRKKTKLKEHYVVFMIEGDDTEQKIQSFLKETKLQAKYTTMEFIDFPSETDPPAILIVNNGLVVTRFYGNDLNKFENAKFLKAFTKIK
jgi:hypothetical protein